MFCEFKNNHSVGRINDTDFSAYKMDKYSVKLENLEFFTAMSFSNI